MADAGATYPVRIDPLLTATADAQLEADQALANLGRSVAPAGDVNGDGFADVIVGAPSFSGLAGSNEGAFYVFHGGAGGFTLDFGIASEQANANLGASVASAGDVNGDGYDDVIVGAPLYGGEGVAFVFLGSPGGLVGAELADAHARIESNQVLAQLGTSVASAGDVNGDGYADVIVGAPFYSAGETGEGAAFVFLGSASGLVASGHPGNADAQLEGDQASGAGFDLAPSFGQSVASAGDVNGDGHADVIVGAPFYNAGEEDEGAAFVFLGGIGGVASVGAGAAHARLESDQVDAELGAAVASTGDVNGDGYADVIVGAPFYANGESNEGAAFVFLGGATGVSSANPAAAFAQLEGNQVAAQSGFSAASAGDVNDDGFADVVVGAPGYDAGQLNEGVAFVYHGGAAGIADTATVRFAMQENALLGWSVSSADVNGDGYADVIVGAPDYDAGEADEGAAFVFLGSAAGIGDGDPSSAHAQLESDQTGAEFGRSVSSAGDVNGDGYADVIVGARLYDAGQTDEGAAFVFLGSAAGIGDGDASSAHAQLESDQAGAEFGRRVSSAGDVNGDGYADVIVGAPFYDAGEADEGAAFVFLGSEAGIGDGDASSAHAQLESDQAAAGLGSVSSAGDVNGDGYADVIVGAPGYDAPASLDDGAAFVFLGSAAGIADGNPLSAHAQLESDLGQAGLGWSVSSAGDVNGDGYADVIVGAPFYGLFIDGAAFVFLGSAAGIADGDPSSAHARLESGQPLARLPGPHGALQRGGLRPESRRRALPAEQHPRRRAGREPDLLGRAADLRLPGGCALLSAAGACRGQPPQRAAARVRRRTTAGRAAGRGGGAFSAERSQRQKVRGPGSIRSWAARTRCRRVPCDARPSSSRRASSRCSLTARSWASSTTTSKRQGSISRAQRSR